MITSRTGIPSVVYGPGAASGSPTRPTSSSPSTSSSATPRSTSRLLTASCAGRREHRSRRAAQRHHRRRRRRRRALPGRHGPRLADGHDGGRAARRDGRRVDVRGGGPGGTRETDLLNPVNMVPSVDAICLIHADDTRRHAGRLRFGRGVPDRWEQGAEVVGLRRGDDYGGRHHDSGGAGSGRRAWPGRGQRPRDRRLLGQDRSTWRRSERRRPRLAASSWWRITGPRAAWARRCWRAWLRRGCRCRRCACSG